MASSLQTDPIWDQNNKDEQTLIQRTRFREILNAARVTLRDHLRLEDVWTYLRQLNVISRLEEETLRENTPNYERVERLLDLLVKGPTWKFHALIRSFCLTNQGYLIREIDPELNPDIYYWKEEQSVEPSNTASASYKRPHEELNAGLDAQSLCSQTSKFAKRKPPNEQEQEKSLMRAIKDHCKSYRNSLMMRNLFDLDDHPAAKGIDTSKCFIAVKAQTELNNRESVEVAAKDILMPVQIRNIGNSLESADTMAKGSDSSLKDPPQTTQLCGQPGAGKTTFLRQLVHDWSTEFLTSNKDSDCLPEGQVTTMVYIEAKSIKGNVREAIMDNLRCKKKDKDILMTHVDEGEGVAIVIDAIDEIQCDEVKADLQKYVKERKNKRGPQVVISSRTDHCPIESLCFDRILVLQGFTVKQGIDYVRRFFENVEESLRNQTMTYVTKYKYHLEGILCNPLRLHIFCALTSVGILKLKKDNVFDVVSLFKLLEQFLLNREAEKEGSMRVTEEDKQNFYKMCLHSILTGQKELPESLLERFQIAREFLVFLDKCNRMDENAELQNFYSFRHHMLCEYFASRCIDNLSVSPTVLLLIITGETSLRNLQKIIFQTMLQQDKQELLLTIMFGILILQNEKKISEKQVPEPILNLCQSMKTINRDELIPAQRKLETRKVTDAWEPIIQYIDNLAETLRDLEWFHDLEENGTIKHIVECLEFCNSRRSEKLTRQTLHRLLPCTYCQDDGEHTDFPVGKSRWGHVLKAKAVFVKAWSVRDTHEALTKHRTQYPNLSLTRMEMNINYFKYRILWGKATDAEWSPEAWNGLMDFLTDTWTLKKLSIYLPYTCPLSGLLTCLASLDPDNESHCLFVEVHYGTVSLEDLETFVDECHDAGLSIILVRTNITIPGTKEDSFLRRRRDELCATKAGKGQEVVQDMFWVKTNGERFNWSDEM